MPEGDLTTPFDDEDHDDAARHPAEKPLNSSPDLADDERAPASAEDRARNFAAALGGALEAFVEALGDDVLDDAAHGVNAAGTVAREGGDHVKAALDSPQMQAVGEKLGSAGTAVAGVASRATHAVADAAHEVQSGVRHVKEGVKVRADAVKETSRRAKGAPRRIGHEMTQAAKAWWHGVMVALSMSIAIGVIGIVTLVLVTIALVVSLNRLVGDPGGTWLAALIYVVLGGIAYATMRSSKAAAQAKTRKHVENSRMEARHVVAPVKSAFGGRGRAGF